MVSQTNLHFKLFGNENCLWFNCASPKLTLTTIGAQYRRDWFAITFNCFSRRRAHAINGVRIATSVTAEAEQ
jgi:hypothetical protein